MLGYVIIRVFLWVIGVAISVFPTLNLVGWAAVDWPLEAATVVNQAGKMRDLLFILVVVAALEFSLLVDFFYVNTIRLGHNRTLLFAAILLVILNLIVLASSLTGFVYLPGDYRLTDYGFSKIVQIIAAGGLIGLVTEIVISCANHHYR
jgi:hypothetical protein